MRLHGCPNCRWQPWCVRCSYFYSSYVCITLGNLLQTLHSFSLSVTWGYKYTSLTDICIYYLIIYRELHSSFPFKKKKISPTRHKLLYSILIWDQTCLPPIVQLFHFQALRELINEVFKQIKINQKLRQLTGFCLFGDNPFIQNPSKVINVSNMFFCQT